MAWTRGDLPLEEFTRIVGGVPIEPETNVVED
jgi:hypothetical protein